MKKFVQTVTAFLLAFAMVAAPVADAQTRGRGGQNTSSGASAPNRPSGNGGNRPSSSHSANRPAHGTSRPTNNGASSNHTRPGQGSQNNRPGNSGNRPGNSDSRPGQGITGMRPVNPGNGTSNGRPGNGGQQHRPERPEGNNNHRPGEGNHRPGNDHYRPSKPERPPRPPRPHRPPRPPRPHPHGYRHPVPFFGAYHRPVPPPRWHYVSGGPVFGTILGVALGTAITASINALVNNGYTVSSYGNNVVYLNDVPQMNYYWPDAALYYTNGVLTGSQFTCPTSYYDLSRYNNLYAAFTAQYGMPVQTTNSGGVISATWYGAGGRYVNLSFNTNYTGSYYTTLSFGN